MFIVEMPIIWWSVYAWFFYVSLDRLYYLYIYIHMALGMDGDFRLEI